MSEGVARETRYGLTREHTERRMMSVVRNPHLKNSYNTYKTVQVVDRDRPIFEPDDDESGISSTTGSASSSLKPWKAYKVYRWRWFMLASLCTLNVSNGMMWLTFAPIPDFTAAYYNISLSSVDWFSMAFFVASLIMGFLSIYILKRFGLRVTVYIGAILNFVGAGVRVLSTIEPIICSSLSGNVGFGVAMVGQILTAVAQPFLLYVPTTLASVWFGPKERAVATGVSSLANPIGLAVAQILSPHVVTTVSKLPMLLWICFIPALLAFIVTMASFWYKEPPSPPTPSASRDNSPSFFRGLQKVLKTPSFLVLMVVWGCAAGVLNALLTILPQLLCPYGYSDLKTGLWGSLMIFVGLFGTLLGSLVLDYTKLLKEFAVVTYSFSVLSFIWFYEVFDLAGQEVNIALSLCVFGFFALPLIPACMELGVEITYPVSEVTSSGLLWSACQVIGLLVVLLTQVFKYPLSEDLVANNNCVRTSHDLNDSSMPQCLQLSSVGVSYTDSTPIYDPSPIILFCLAIISINFFFLTLCFWPKYKRLDSDKRNSFEKSIRVRT